MFKVFIFDSLVCAVEAVSTAVYTPTYTRHCILFYVVVVVGCPNTSPMCVASTATLVHHPCVLPAQRHWYITHVCCQHSDIGTSPMCVASTATSPMCVASTATVVHHPCVCCQHSDSGTSPMCVASTATVVHHPCVLPAQRQWYITHVCCQHSDTGEEGSYIDRSMKTLQHLD